MATLLRSPQSVRALPFCCKPLRAARSQSCLLVSNSGRVSPSQLLIAPISQTLVAISKSLSLSKSLAEAMMRSVSARPAPGEEVMIKALRSKLSMAGAGGLCFAAISAGSVNTPLTVVASGMAKWLELYSGVLMLRVLLSWFPNIPWERQPLQAIRDMCDPYLNLFRNIIPPLFNALDVSPLLAFLVLGILTSVLNTAVQA